MWPLQFFSLIALPPYNLTLRQSCFPSKGSKCIYSRKCWFQHGDALCRYSHPFIFNNMLHHFIGYATGIIGLTHESAGSNLHGRGGSFIVSDQKVQKKFTNLLTMWNFRSFYTQTSARQFSNSKLDRSTPLSSREGPPQKLMEGGGRNLLRVNCCRHHIGCTKYDK